MSAVMMVGAKRRILAASVVSAGFNFFSLFLGVPLRDIVKQKIIASEQIFIHLFIITVSPVTLVT
jgi:hypothetical protein